MAGKERRELAGGLVRGVKACTRLSAPGVPCGPGSGVREGGEEEEWRRRMKRRRRMN